MIVIPHCQREQLVAEHTLLQVVHGRVNGGLGLRPRLRRILHPRPAPPREGTPSRYQVGDWVRVLDDDAIRAKLDDHARTRGLLFSRQQWGFCGHVARVSKIVRRIVDDNGQMRAVSRTVLLEGVDCDGVDHHQGCGRLCPLMFRDEWLAPAHAPEAPAPAEPRIVVRIKPVDEIRATLDWRGRRGGLMFMPEQARYAGGEYRVLRKLDRVIEADREDAIVREPIYALDTPRCSGAARDGCDRACGLLWHGDWLVWPAPGDPPATISALPSAR